jgi:hypothetical protein
MEIAVMSDAVKTRRRPTAKRLWPYGKPKAWRKLPPPRPDHEYPDQTYKLRIWLRDEIKECRRRANNCKWYAEQTKDDPLPKKAYFGWVKARRERLQTALEHRDRLRKTNF